VRFEKLKFVGLVLETVKEPWNRRLQPRR